MKKTYEIIGNPNANVLETEIYYSLGGMNYFTYKNEPRGYYFSIAPYQRNGITKSFTAFSGAKMCIMEVKRKSKAAAAKANARMDELEAKYLKPWCEAHGYKLGKLISEET